VNSQGTGEIDLSNHTNLSNKTPEFSYYYIESQNKAIQGIGSLLRVQAKGPSQ